MKCPHCNFEFTPPSPPADLWALKYMVAKGWLFAGTLCDDKWKADRELVDWLNKGWIEMDAEKGFRITRLGEKVSQNS